MAKQIHHDYSRELEFKKAMVGSVQLHGTGIAHDLLVAYASCWVCEPYISNEAQAAKELFSLAKGQ
jgi:hypothetical protein